MTETTEAPLKIDVLEESKPKKSTKVDSKISKPTLEHTQGQLYDVIYYKDHFNQEALKHLKRLPKDEQVSRKFAVGINLRNMKRFPTSNATGKQMTRAAHGFTWLMDTQRNHLFDYVVIQKSKDDHDEIVGGILKQEAYENEEFKQRVETSIKTESDRDLKLSTLRNQLVSSVKNVSNNAAYRYKIAIAHLGGIKKPSKLSDQELSDVVDALILSDEIPVPDINKWFAIHCQDVETINTQIQSLDKPFEVGDDKNFESICARVRGGSPSQGI